MIRFYSLLLLFITSISLKAQTVVRDVQYVNDTLRTHRLDIYIPTNANQALPLAIYIHGGGWQGGTKGGGAGWLKAMINNGYVCADINYRLSGDSVWPAQLYDCKAAIRYLKANATQYHIDTCRVGVIGSSAGGHLVSVLATTGNYAALEGAHLGNAHVSSKVHAAIPAFGPVDFFQMDDYIPSTCTNPIVHSFNSPETHLLGCDSLKNCPSRVISANPVTYLDANDPPMYITHGDADCSVPVRQSIVLDSNFRAVGVPTQLHIAASEGHGAPFFTTQQQQIIYKAFFDTALKVCINTSAQTPTTNSSTSVYPNPVQQGIFYINAEATIEYLYVFDALGRQVFKTDNVPTNTAINISELQKGFYTATFFVRGQVYRKALIIE